MKTKIFIMIAGLMLALFSCQKDSDVIDQKTLDDVDFDAVADAVFEDIFNAAEDASFSAEPVAKGEATEMADCPVITITHPEGALWPKTVTLDYGTGCTGFNNNTRAGRIITVVTGPRMTTGSKRTVTLENYSFNDIKVEGTKVFENKGLNANNNMVVSVTLTGGKTTFPDGKTIERTVNHEREWIAGLSTRNIFDDECLITGTASGKNRRGVEYTNKITTPLHWTRACKFITEGVVEISLSGQDKPMTLNYGNGDCDAKATVTRGDQSKEILLRHKVN
ncbi:MAG TPA: hypothetical protein VK155_16960 [Bacteroidales bacterium]|nr:hypothetical protein [Bacteroidales bacterium]